jgi:hypothetical protein
MLDLLQRESFGYFEEDVSHATGLVLDRTQPHAPASSAATGFALTCYPIAVERGWWSRARAVDRVTRTLRTLHRLDCPHGFYWHFVDATTGARAGNSEVSSIDTAILAAGALTSASFFDRTTELEIRELADELYRRIDWPWLANDNGTLRHGWTPETGLLATSWDRGYSEAHIAYVLALGSPTHAVSPAGYRAWTDTFELRRHHDIDWIAAGPLFIHQLSQVWLDLRGRPDGRMRRAGFDYFDNSRRATTIQRAYAIANAHRFEHYTQDSWGFTASDGPGPWRGVVDGVDRVFFGYAARGAPDGPDDGTLSPWAVVASLPFAPDMVCSATRHVIEQLALENHNGAGFAASFNPTFPHGRRHPLGWVSPWRFAINQGPIVVMIENHTSEMVWRLAAASPHITRGLAAAGFT